MTDNENEDAPDEGGDDSEEKSFRERVEEIRQQRAGEREEGDGEGMSREEKMEEMMGGGPGGPGGPGGMGGMGGSPFAQMMGGMMGGGGPGGALGGAPGGRGREEGGDEELVREVRKVRDELHDIRRELERVADALEN